MGRLTCIAPRLGVLPSRLPRQADAHGHSRTAEPWRAWYSTPRWRALRDTVLLRDLYTCQWPGCGRLIQRPRDRICDHILPHRGDPDLFWSITNLQTLCKPCHDTRKQAAERRAAAGGGSKL